jgi:ribosomal-protein-alanine acetyltransferase
MPSWSLRSARPDDVDALARLEGEIFTTDAWSPAMLASELASPHTYYIVASDVATGAEEGHGEEVAGYAGLFAPGGSGEADIQTVAVRRESRGLGLGRTMVTELIEEAARRGARRVFLEVRADNAVAQHLYDTLGFTRIAVRPRYYQPDDVDALVMRRLIVPVRQTSAPMGSGDDRNERKAV